MEGVYEISSTERVLGLERELERELNDLQVAIEDGNFLSSGDQPQSFSSILIPKDIKYFRNERKIAIRNLLQCNEAKQLDNQAELMQREMETCLKYEYTSNSIPLLLHQFFVSRTKELLMCKHLHMLRWARFCEYSKEMEVLYSDYKQRLNEIMEEYSDAVSRAQRLSKSREALLMHSNIPNSIVKNEDLVIYTRWLISYFHSVKKFNSYMKVIKWIPQSQSQGFELKEPDTAKIVDSLQFDVTVDSSRHSILHPSLSQNESTDSVLHTNMKRRASSLMKWKSAVKIKVIQKLKNEIPTSSLNLNDFGHLMDSLLEDFKIDMNSMQLSNSSDEMDLLNLTIRKFRQVHFRQCQRRNFETYDFTDPDEEKKSKGEDFMIYKKESNWLPFIQIKPDIDEQQISAFAKLKEINYIDEILFAQSRFLRIESSEKVLYLLREHAKQTQDITKTKPSYVTSYRQGSCTKNIWDNIFNYSSYGKQSGKDELLEFDARVLDEDLSKSNESEYDIKDSLHKLGFQSDDVRKHPITDNGAYLSYLLLQHLQIKDRQQKCLNNLNYFRSIERTLTINDVGFSFDEAVFSTDQSHSKDTSSLGSHQYIHNTPADYVVNAFEHLQYQEVTNHDDFYVYKDDNVLIQDQNGPFIMYDAALADFRRLEEELLLVASHYIQKHTLVHSKDISIIYLQKLSNQKVDRFAIMLEMWTNEALFIEKKKNLLDIYFEVYQHTMDVEERKKLTKVMTTIVKQRPRMDFNLEYFNKSYQFEIALLSMQCELVKSIVDEMINDQREYIQRISREPKHKYGLPFKVIPKQKISVNTSKTALQNVFMLEFHPSLSVISNLPQVLHLAYQQLLHVHQPNTVSEKICLDLQLIEHAQRCWENKVCPGTSYSKQMRKDVFSDMFIEDPLFVCEVGESATTLKDVKGSRGNKNEDIKKMMDCWGKILEVITWRHRLVDIVNECDILMSIYHKYLHLASIDECHSYLRSVSFDFAQKKPMLQKQPMTLKLLLEDESRIDRYIPNFSMLAIQELDEKHIATFSLKNRESFSNLLQGSNVDKLRLALLAQTGQKNMLASAVQLMVGYIGLLRGDYMKLFKVPSQSQSVPKSTSFLALTGVTSSQIQMKNFFERFQFSILSLQAEKTYYRDLMLNEFVAIKEKKSMVTSDDIIRTKKLLIERHCIRLQRRVSEHVLRSQILAYLYSLHQLLSHFPVTRDAHFMFGEQKKEADDIISDDKQKNSNSHDNFDPGNLQRRTSQLLSSDGQTLENLWYLPHCSEVLECYKDPSKCSEILTIVLRLMAAIHDICQYLCAHARSGSSHARMGSQKLEFAGVSADWGGTEGIGAELREIQRQIDLLPSPKDPVQVAEYLEQKRDIMYLKYDITIRNCVKDTFLSSGNTQAYQSMADTTDYSLNRLSNKVRPPAAFSQLDIPEPLLSDEHKTQELFPWRSFINGNRVRVGDFGPFYRVAEEIQLPLLGLKNINRHVVHGEILGVSLLLEDVLSAGKPHLLDSLSQSRPTSRLQARPSSVISKRTTSNSPVKDTESYSLTVDTGVAEILSDNELSFHKNPMTSVQFIRTFLLVWSRLELLKRYWGCRRLSLHEISTCENLKRFLNVYNTEILNVVYKLIVAHEKSEIFLESSSSEDLILLPKHITEYEIKLRQLVKLLEMLECHMLKDCIRKISREHMLVLAERAREDRTLPTDLWKKTSMKENFKVTRPSIVEDFLDDLKLLGDGLIITVDRPHLDECLMKLATACMAREKKNYLSYASFYENLLRQQNQILYTKEQEIKHLQNNINSLIDSTEVKVDCGLADKSYNLLVEITALRTKITGLENHIDNEEKVIGKRLRHSYNDLVFALFSKSFNMKTKFEKYQSSLYLDVRDTLQKVRSIAVEKLKHVRVKHGIVDHVDSTSRRLIMAEKLREAQTENEHLALIMSKLRAINVWHRMKNKSLFSRKISEYQSSSARATKIQLENSLLFEEKEILMKEEQESLRKLLKKLEKDSDTVRRELQKEQKLKMQRSHTQIQEAQSNRYLELAKNSNYEKLLAALEEKDEELKNLRTLIGSEQRPLSSRSSHDFKRLLNETLQQMRHERNMKHEAFERVDELQKQVHELEKKVIDLIGRDKNTYHESCLPLVPGGRTSPSRFRPCSSGINAIKLDTRPATSMEMRRPKSCTAPRKNILRSQSIEAKLRQNKSEGSIHKTYTKK